MTWIYEPDAWMALATLTALETVLGIDNIVFISILVSRLPEKQRDRARIIGLALAMLTRIALLLCLSWVMSLTQPLIQWKTVALSGRDLILIGGGLFLLAKSTHEIHHSLEVAHDTPKATATARFGMVMFQVMILDIVFSLDSVITAVGLARHLPVMIIAIMLSIAIMMLSAGAIGRFVDRHPTFKILALSFLILIGVTLMAEGFSVHVPKGYIYFAMAFSLGVELLNIRVRAKAAAPVPLHKKGGDQLLK